MLVDDYSRLRCECAIRYSARCCHCFVFCYSRGLRLFLDRDRIQRRFSERLSTLKKLPYPVSTLLRETSTLGSRD